ncbi:UDP-2,3-diacylglucosamine hydrolase [Litorivivens lipolytica]|uniref:UDP-2,3-diacylglucosamine hydrolase n=1 Tax=Litorivivens lipolytica TaxID=1524264 RepID=A0A7W4W3Z2_9GAMM|nr:UDP-2,3-diacylglucosamine diphosphatase [Litorivivens lipolytica]MBB3046439.1 UDP-2,3-diacylglucosamine hydrolase [Litorivivens lipolytica]
MTTLFISDLHLDEKRPDIYRAFLHFLENTAKDAEALYVLGDLFEAWVGDDDDANLARESIAAFRRLADSGTALYFLHGNRDFLLGEQFATETGGTLLDDPSKIDLYGTPTLLMHGDSLCTADTEYQSLRVQLRSAEWQQQLLSQPLAARRQLAEQLRMASSEATSNKAEDIMDVTPEEVVKALKEHGCTRLIHGHTHRPARHALTVQRQPAERIVLGDWDRYLWYLAADENQLSLEKQLIAQ